MSEEESGKEVMCRGYWRNQYESERVVGAAQSPEGDGKYDTEVVHPHMVRPAWIEQSRGKKDE